MWEQVPKWLFSAAFFSVVVIVVYLLISGNKVQLGPDYYGFVSEDQLEAQEEVRPLPLYDTEVTGKVQEPDSADKRFYSDQSCTVGEVRGAILGSGAGRQAGICACVTSSPAGNSGKGWYCIE